MAQPPDMEGGLPTGEFSPGDEDIEGKYPDSDVIWGGPALFTNKVWVIYSSSWIRLTFAEQGNPDEAAKFRAAVAMPPAEAIAFSEALERVLKPYKEALAARQEPADDEHG